MLSQLIFTNSACVWLLGDVMEKKIFVAWMKAGRDVGTHEYVHSERRCFSYTSTRTLPVCMCVRSFKTLIFVFTVTLLSYYIETDFRKSKKILPQNTYHGPLRTPEIILLEILLFILWSFSDSIVWSVESEKHGGAWKKTQNFRYAHQDNHCSPLWWCFPSRGITHTHTQSHAVLKKWHSIYTVSQTTSYNLVF